MKEIRGITGKGDRFVIYKDENLWHWKLWVSNSPSITPAAKSGRGYRSENAAKNAIRKARWAAANAPDEPIVE